VPSGAARTSLELTALGDFEPNNESAEVLPAERAGAPLKFPVATLAVLARLDADDVAFAGYDERRGDGDLDVLLWPTRQSCTVAGGDGYPGRGGGQALGFASESGTLFVAGGNDPRDTEAILGSLRFGTGSGRVERGGIDGGGLSLPRAFATVTRFGGGFLVAGGQRPLDGVPESNLEVYANAEVFDPERGAFASELVPLQNSRTHHAALTLDDGRTLLIGGRTKAESTSIAQYQLELVDPVSLRVSVADAIAPRIDPVALRLSDGRIFVGGGTLTTGSLSAPVAEWLGADAHRAPTKLSADVPPRFERAFVAVPGGGVLAVGGCEDRPPASETDAARCQRCRSGCEPLEGYDAWWIDAQGGASPVSLPGISAPRPLLLPGSDGSPWLVAASAEHPETARLFRFNPWAARFEPAAGADRLELPRPALPAPLTLAPDTFVWVDDEGELFGLRLGARSRYANDVSLVLAYEPNDPGRPQHLVPTRALGDGDALSYDGKLELRSPEVAVLVTDTDYADVTIRLRVSGARLPRVLLGDTALGGDACPWPEGDARGDDAERPTVVRRGERAQLRYHGARSAPCAVGEGRLAVGLVAGAGRSLVTELQIVRDAPGATAF
jgi:hypothetical protein